MDVSAVSYHHVLRRQWSHLVRELPEASVLLSDPVLFPLFTEGERNEIRCQQKPSERAVWLLRAVGRKGADVFRAFVSVLMRYRPSLADSLIRSAEGMDGGRQNGIAVELGHQLRPKMNGDDDCHGLVETEDAGPMDFNACGPGPAYHLQHMSITSRHTLAAKIKELGMFHEFCRALGVDNELERRASRSGNPTAYMLQEYQERPEATFDRLEQALSGMGCRDLFEEIWQLTQE